MNCPTMRAPSARSTRSCCRADGASATTRTGGASPKVSAADCPMCRLNNVVQLGAGGAGAAVAHAALTLGARKLAIFDLDASARAESGRRPLRTLRRRSRSCGHRSGCSDGDGRRTDSRHADGNGEVSRAAVAGASCCGHALWVAEIVYFPLETELLREARRLGCRTMNGSGMAVFQAVEAFRLFTGIAPDAERMQRHFASMGGKLEPVNLTTKSRRTRRHTKQVRGWHVVVCRHAIRNVRN